MEETKETKEQYLGFVYKWTNLVNNRYYIGSHKGQVNDGYIGSGKVFKYAVKKHGIDNFIREILYVGEYYREKEEEILKSLDAANDDMSYNLKNDSIGATLPGELNGMFGKTIPDKSKKQMSETLSKGERWGSEKKRKEHSIKTSGKNNPMYGGHSEYSKNKMRITKSLNKEEWSHLITGVQHRLQFLNIYKTLKRHGEICYPRNQKILEIENFNYVLQPYVRFTSFKARNINLDYIKKEFLWYLKGDKYDTSITEHAKIWKNLINDDNSINSNYGQYIFGEQKQFHYVINELIKDKDSRRASIVILNQNHLVLDSKDTPCTYSINFRIRKNKLNMTIRMRSQDAIFGMTNDAACFSIIHEMVYVYLKNHYNDLEYGDYYHSCDSFHIYERHFRMLDEILGRHEIGLHHPSPYTSVLCPKISCKEEVDCLMNLHNDNYEVQNDNFKFTKWLLSDIDRNLKNIIISDKLNIIKPNQYTW